MAPIVIGNPSEVRQARIGVAEPLVATQFFCDKRGSSSACLVAANDGHYYVTKSQDSQVGPEGLIRDAVGHELARSVKMSVRPWRVIRMPPILAEEIAALGRVAARPNLWFASRMPGHPSVIAHWTLTGFDPLLVPSIANLRDELPKAVLLNLGIGQMDSVQGVVVRLPRVPGHPSSFHIDFIDWNFALGASTWDLSKGLIDLHALELAARVGVAEQDWEAAFDSFQQLNPTDFERIRGVLPAEWLSPETGRRLDALLATRGRASPAKNLYARARQIRDVCRRNIEASPLAHKIAWAAPALLNVLGMQPELLG